MCKKIVVDAVIPMGAHLLNSLSLYLGTSLCWNLTSPIQESSLKFQPPLPPGCGRLTRLRQLDSSCGTWGQVESWQAQHQGWLPRDCWVEFCRQKRQGRGRVRCGETASVSSSDCSVMSFGALIQNLSLRLSPAGQGLLLLRILPNTYCSIVPGGEKWERRMTMNKVITA